MVLTDAFKCSTFQHDRDEFVTSNSFVCFNGKTEVSFLQCLWNNLSTNVSERNWLFQYDGAVYPQHILLLCKTKLQTICISPTRKDFNQQESAYEISRWNLIEILYRWINTYTQYENQIDVYNEIVRNGMNPDSSSWDFRKTFELMKDPRIKTEE